MNISEIYNDYLNFWYSSERPLTSLEAAIMFLEDNEIYNVMPDELTDLV